MDSISEQIKNNAVSIVLSGLDGDGSLGTLHVGAMGGLTIAQLPSTADFPSMPEGALKVGKARYSLTPKSIGKLLTQFTSVPNRD